MRPLPHMLCTQRYLQPLLIQTLATFTKRKEGKKKYKGEVYRSTGAQGSNCGCFGIANIADVADVADIVMDIADIATDIAVETGRRV